ncbi:MAG: cytidine deaminase [Mangrovibacterium sp.]
MKIKEVKIQLNIYNSVEELSVSDGALVLAARRATATAYAPYSNFKVGAAVLLSNGETISGSNQENAATPAGICAERTALNWIGANRAEHSIVCIAISAINQQGEPASGLSPCGICRQALVEFQNRQKHPIRILLDNKEGITEISNALDILPLSFDASSLKSPL